MCVEIIAVLVSQGFTTILNWSAKKYLYMPETRIYVQESSSHKNFAIEIFGRQLNYTCPPRCHVISIFFILSTNWIGYPGTGFPAIT